MRAVNVATIFHISKSFFIYLPLINRFFNNLILTAIGKLISVTVYAEDSTAFASASIQPVQADFIKYAATASTKQKQSNPAASGSINSVLYLNWDQNNAGQDHVWMINESLSTLVSNS